MQLQLKAVGMELTESAKTYAEEKLLVRLERFIEENHRDSAVIEVHLEYAASNTADTRDKCRATITGLGKGTVVRAEEEAPEMHVAIDQCGQKLEQQLRRHHSKIRDHLHRGNAEAKHVPPEALMETAPIDERFEETPPTADQAGTEEK